MHTESCTLTCAGLSLLFLKLLFEEAHLPPLFLGAMFVVPGHCKITQTLLLHSNHPRAEKNWACSACHCCCYLTGPNHLAKPKKNQVARTDDHENLPVYSQCPAALKPQSSTNEGTQGEITERQKGRARVGRGIASC